MNTDERKQRLSQILAIVAESLDIPDSKYREAVSHYEAVGKWLDANDSALHVFRPEVYPQGSFSLGTMVKPINDGDEYDIDLVCQLGIDKNNVTKNELKNMVGARLRRHATYKEMLTEGKRCWTLDYANEFHMDILPGIPDLEKLDDAILITDRKLREWQPSNPKGYVRWFRGQMRVIFEQRRSMLAERLQANVEEVPEYRVRTPLQRSVQILKRHRDIHFANRDDKPISIIVTTLAARSYGNEADLYDALASIVTAMTADEYLRHPSGYYYIPNPTNLEENFAEKWNEDDRLPQAFLAWLTQLRTDLGDWIEFGEIPKLGERLERAFGAGAAENALSPFVETSVSASSRYPKVEFTTKANEPWTTG
jgi:hypothetical protein